MFLSITQAKDNGSNMGCSTRAVLPVHSYANLSNYRHLEKELVAASLPANEVFELQPLFIQEPNKRSLWLFSAQHH